MYVGRGEFEPGSERMSRRHHGHCTLGQLRPAGRQTSGTQTWWRSVSRQVHAASNGPAATGPAPQSTS